MPRLSPSWWRWLASWSLLWLAKSGCPNCLSSTLVRAWRFHCFAGARSRSTCNTFPSKTRTRWEAASSSFQPLGHAANWTCERYNSSFVSPLYLSGLAAVLGAAQVVHQARHGVQWWLLNSSSGSDECQQLSRKQVVSNNTYSGL